MNATQTHFPFWAASVEREKVGKKKKKISKLWDKFGLRLRNVSIQLFFFFYP